VILVDTHVVIWLTHDRSELSATALHALLENREAGGLAIADISLREISALNLKRRITLSKPLDIYLRFIESLFQVLPINGRIALRSTQFIATYPKDPADQLIGATAIVHGLSVITKDEGIRSSGEVNCIW